MTDTMTSQNIDLSSWDILYMNNILIRTTHFPELMLHTDEHRQGRDTEYITNHTNGSSLQTAIQRP
jgi:hypothetical protein